MLYEFLQNNVRIIKMAHQADAFAGESAHSHQDAAKQF